MNLKPTYERHTLLSRNSRLSKDLPKSLGNLLKSNWCENRFQRSTNAAICSAGTYLQDAHSEYDSCSWSRNSLIFWNSNVHNRLLRSKPEDTILRQLITVSIFTPYSSKIDFITAFLFTQGPLTYCRYFEEVRISVGARGFPRLQALQPRSETRPDSCSVGTKCLSLEVKWTGREMNCLPPYYTVVNNELKQLIHFLYMP
jgi:hypothetical protein